MKGFMIGVGIIFLIGLFVTLMLGTWIWGTYNIMVTSRIACDTSWSQIETQYQRRFDLIPNLVAATKGYLIQEQVVFGAIAEARTKYGGVISNKESTADEKVAAGNELESALSRLLVIVENYPALKSDRTVQDLMFELSGTENRISVARQRYNETVQSYNTTLSIFPGNLLAGMFGFKEKVFFKGKTGTDEAPVVNLDTRS